MTTTRIIVAVLYLTSLTFFVLGLLNPIMSSEIISGWWSESHIYLIDSVDYFFKEGEMVIGTIVLLFSIVFPILKYIFLGLETLGFHKLAKIKILNLFLDIINKWAMLDVFVVALVIINMKFDSILIKTKISIGATYFALSIVILTVCAFILKRFIINKINEQENSI